LQAASCELSIALRLCLAIDWNLELSVESELVFFFGITRAAADLFMKPQSYIEISIGINREKEFLVFL